VSPEFKVSGVRFSFRVPRLWLPGGVSVSGVRFPGLSVGVQGLGPGLRDVQGSGFGVPVSGFPGFDIRGFGLRV